MGYQRIVVSSGHGLYVRGAAGIIDEVDQARLVVDRLAEVLEDYGVEVTALHDNVSRSQNENLWWLTDQHNACKRDLDISVHFNAFEQTSSPKGCEVWYVTQQELARKLSAAMATIGLKDRHEKYTDDLHFLNQTTMPSVLLEVCFVNSSADCAIYQDNFEALIEALAGELVGEEAKEVAQPFVAEGRVSYFGGPSDPGVSPSEGLAFLSTRQKISRFYFSATSPKGPPGTCRGGSIPSSPMWRAAGRMMPRPSRNGANCC